MRTLVFIALAAAWSNALATQPLLPAGGNDQVPTRLAALPAPAGQFERAPVSFSWALDPSDPLSTPDTHVAESRESWQTVEGSELARGVDLALTAPGAMIRVSPASGSARLDPADIH